MYILEEKRYDIQLISYMKTLEQNPTVVDQKVRDNTIKSVINQTATFLTHKCPECSLKLIDPVGIKLITSLRHARCGNCGFKTLIPL
jgi:DNA-directed RNA polymerase subunit RPC12/RpoP